MSKMNKPRLGRGLSSLISVSDDLPDGLPNASISPIRHSELSEPRPAVDDSIPIHQRVMELGLDQVQSNPHQPRKEFAEQALRELAASLKTNGVIQPIVVRKTVSGYELIAGERRLRAAKLAGLLTVPAIVKEVDGLTQAQLALVENIQREDLNPIDRAQAYKTLLDQLGLSHGELAIRLGEDRSIVSNHLRLLELAVPVRELLRSQKLSLGHAKVLAGVTDVLEQERLGNLVVSQELSVRNLERLVQGAKPANKPIRTLPSAHIKDLEKAIGSQLGLKVSVKSKPNGSGRLVVNYTDLDQFDELMRRMNLKVAEEG